MGAFIALNGGGKLTTSTDLTFTTTRAIDVGEYVVVSIGAATGRVSVGTVTVGALSLAQDVGQATNMVSAIWSARATSLLVSGTTVTVHTSTTTASWLGASCFSLKGIVNPAKDQTATNSGTGTSFTSGTTSTTTNSQEIAIMMYAQNTNGASTITGGFTSISLQGTATTGQEEVAYKDITGLQTVSGTATITSSNWGGCIATYLTAPFELTINNYQFVKAPDGISVTEKIR